MPPPRTQPDPDQLLAEMVALRLIGEEPGRDFLNTFRATVGRDEGIRFVEFLIQASVLTAYQGNQLLSGEGSRLACGSYQITTPMGPGELGPSYLAIGRGDRKSYVVEMLPLRNLWNVHLAKQHIRTIQTLPPHPALVPISTIDSTAWCHYLVWPYVTGESLDRIIGRTGPVDPDEAVRLAVQVVDGLAVLHNHSLYYGLLKPANIVIDPERRLRFLKLGVGTILGENLTESDSLLDTISSANSAVGMIDYTAPELVGEVSAQTAAGDAYSLGGLIYFMVTGLSPFPDGTAVEKMIALVQSKPMPVRERRPDVPGPLADLVDRLLCKSPEDRLVDLAVIRAELLASVPSSPERAPSPSLFVPPPVFQAEAMTILPDTGMTTPRIRPGRPGDSDAMSLSPVRKPSELTADNDYGPPSFQPILAAPSADSDRPVPPSTSSDPVPSRQDWSPLDKPRPNSAAPIDSQEPPRLLRLQFLGWRFLRSVGASRSHRDLVQLSVFGPASFAPGVPAAVQVYIHQQDAFVGVQSMARANLPDDDFLAAGYASRLLIRGKDNAAIHLGVGGVKIDTPLVETTWTGATWHTTFSLSVPSTIQTARTSAIVTLGLDGIAAGRVAFTTILVPMADG